jgi:hypothetical protein
LGACGVGNVDNVRRSTSEALLDRSLRRLGQLLVVMGALLGAVLGVSLALVVDNAETSRAVAEPGRERAAVLAASPPASRAATTQDPGDGTDASDNQRAASADRADQGDGKADKNGDSRGDKASSRGKDKPGKGKSGGNDK